MVKQLANFINGAFVAPCKGQYLESKNPATAKINAMIPDSDSDDMDAAVAAAKAAFPAWSKTTAQARADMLNKIADLIESRMDEFAVAESEDQGKPVSLARAVDIPRAAYNFRFFAGAILHHQDQSTSMDGFALNYTHRKPVGVAGLISPWNLPLYLLTWKIGPALATGNTAVAKPSEMTSVTAHMLCEVMQEAGLPPGVCNMVFGYGGRAGAALVSHPQVPLISFTGGTQTAIRIQQDAAPYFKKMSLELGGKNANIIFEDADFKKAVKTGVRAAFANQGEICLCGSRIFVQRSIYDRFVEAYIEETKKLVVGDPKDPKTNVGALVSEAHYEKVKSYVALAKEEGGEIVHGGVPPQLEGDLANGYFLIPTVITGLTQASRTMCEEIFGPVVTIAPFDTEEEVIGYANGTQYGLSGMVWTENLSRGHRVAQAIDSGIMWVNTWMLRDLRTPFGGMKASGVGREGGEHSIDFYTEAQNICIKIN